MTTASERESILAQFRWPQTGDHPFAAGDGRSPQAWPHEHPAHKEFLLAEGYRAVADRMIKVLEEDDVGWQGGMYFPPIAMLYRHFLELSLKLVIKQGTALKIIPDADLTKIGHNLDRLWRLTRQVVEALNPRADLAPVYAVEQVVLEFQRMDGSGQEFRYAFTTAGQPSLKNAPERVCLSNLRDVMEGVNNFFSGIDGQLGEAMDWKWDMEAEARSEY